MAVVQLRKTKQKDAIRGVFQHTDRPLTIDEIHAEAQKAMARVSVATIYRNIHSLVEEGWLVTLPVPGLTNRYELAGKRHHHHFQCTGCEKTFELSGCAIDTRPKVPKGFKASSHEFFVYGTCDVCTAGA